MADILIWPHELLTPEDCHPNLVSFTRSGGRSLGGIEPAIRTDLGYWSIELSNVAIHTREHARTWNAIRQRLGGRPGLIAVPAWSFDSSPYVSGERELGPIVSHDDDSIFGDGTPYQQAAISVVSDGVTPLAATTIRLRVINAERDLVGVRFSYNHALYETGPAIDVSGDIWTLPISPSVREFIPSGAELNFDMPTCLCHLQDDRGMDGRLTPIEFDQRSVSFIEATDYWNSLVNSN
jgi:hypothetical protein